MDQRLLAVVSVFALVLAGSVGGVASADGRETRTAGQDIHATDNIEAANATDAIDATDAAAVGIEGPTLQQESDEDCDFDDLYNETIDSVVTIRVWDERGDRGQGSGWVYQRNGSTAYVVTNWHVVTNLFGADVQFARGEWRSATELVGLDFYSDLAVLRVENVPEYVQTLPVADSLPNRGDEVAAFGSPFGLQGTITTGIVSAVDRSVSVQNRTIADAIQLDAPINPGNSGGPLVSCEGEAIGVNYAGVGPVDAGINFAISASMVRRVVPSLIQTGTFDHSYLGIQAITLSPTVARVNGLDGQTRGVLVSRTIAGGPSDEELRGSASTERITGLPVGGDVIVAIDNTPVESLQGLEDYLFEETDPGETVTLTVIRDGERQQVEVTLGTKSLPRGSRSST